ncbi:MAG: septum formation protein Maf [Oligosphaeraceae bacterium]|nr:septum formation protein Maf [Oligosphaeraceae bacterium]
MVLASSSPRRQELLRQAGIEFSVHPADLPEHCLDGESPAQTVIRLAEAKAAAVSELFPGQIVLGADTLVSLDGRAVGKPADLSAAKALLRQLSGRTHEVHTGVCLCRKAAFSCSWACCSQVTFKDLNHADIERYVALVNTLDKAGAYALQEHGEMIIATVAGDRNNVIGLPIDAVRQKLRDIVHHESTSATGV